jgi:cytidylate kinase
MKSQGPFIIAVDGYSSCGKSTYARLIAKELDYVYIDSGAMYRAVALYAIEKGLVNNKEIDIETLKQSLDNIHITFRLNKANGVQETWLNGVNVEEKIRGIEVSEVVSKISRIRNVREKMVAFQRIMGGNGSVVMDGRDIGSVVFPGATLKIFMTAGTDVRAMRRFKELKAKGMNITLEEVKENIQMRDNEDENRKESPLTRAHDAILLDNSQMTIEQQMTWFREEWKKIMKKHETSI